MGAYPQHKEAQVGDFLKGEAEQTVSAREGWIVGYAASIAEGEERLAKAIIQADRAHSHACTNQGISDQVGAQQRLDDLHTAFAYATVTAVSEMHFQSRLAAAKERVAAATRAESQHG